MEFTLYTANCTGNAANCLYPNGKRIASPEELALCVTRDQVYAKYKDNYRSIANFLFSDVVPMDVDNDHSENPADWITAEKLRELFYEAQFALVPSRHHMKEKGGKAARPRYHVLFPVQGYADAGRYAALKAAIQRQFPFFDGNALDAGRFFFGCPCKAEDIVWHEGFGWIDEDVVTELESGELRVESEEWRVELWSWKIPRGIRARSLPYGSFGSINTCARKNESSCFQNSFCEVVRALAQILRKRSAQ